MLTFYNIITCQKSSQDFKLHAKIYDFFVILAEFFASDPAIALL